MDKEIRVSANPGISGYGGPSAVGGYMPHPQSMPIFGPNNQGGMPQGQAVQKSQFSKLSMFFMAMSLMLTGAVLFFGGLLCGMWLSGDSTRGVGGASTQMRSQTGGGTSFGLSREADDLGLSNIASGQLGYQAQNAVNQVDTSHLPTFLQPLAAQVKYTVAGQAQNKTASVIQNVSQKPSSGATNKIPEVAADSRTVATSVGTDMDGGSAVDFDSSGSVGVGGQYAIQLGIYAAKENAESFQSNLRGMGFDSYIVSGKDRDGQEVYYVRVGHYGSHRFASIVAAQFNSQGIPGVTIIKEDNKK